MSTTPLSILVIDEHQLFAAGLSEVLQMMQQPVRVTELYNGVQALTELEQNQTYDLVLIDLDMPSVAGIELLVALALRGLLGNVAAISGTMNDALVQRSMDIGARAFIPKPISPEIMLAGMREVLAGRRYLPEHLVGRIDVNLRETLHDTNWPVNSPRPVTKAPRKRSRDNVEKLSERQGQILELIAEGKTNKQIAGVLSISQSTVKFHIAALFKILQVKTRTECVHVARQLNLTD